MKILCVISGLGSPGGAEKVLTTLTQGWIARGDTVHVISFDAQKVTPFFPLANAVQLHALDSSTKRLSLLKKLPALCTLRKKLLRKTTEIAPDVILSFMDQVGILSILSRLHTIAPVVIAEHNNPATSSIMEWPTPLRQIFNLVRRLSYKNAAAIVTLTKECAEYFVQQGITTTEVIPNPIAPELLMLKVRPVLERTTQIVAMGRLCAQKRFDLLIAAFQKIANDHRQWHLVIVGEGPLRTTLETQIAAFGLSARIQLIGTHSSPQLVVRESQLLVQSSDYEGFPMVLLEALALGTPCIATRCQFGPEEILKNGRYGVLVPCDDVEMLAHALDATIKDNAKRETLSVQGTEAIAAYSLPQILKRWDALFTKVLRQMR